MAFDQSTRNRLQRLVTDARRTLEEEFTRQLQNDYGLDPISGTASPLESLRHINDQQRETARILRDTLAHYCVSADTDTKAGLDRIVREQAFTVLNRLAALRMAEARGLLMESVGNGYQAKGFQLYARLAGTGLGETGDAYRVYLQSVFDELSQDLPGLFDRFSPQGRLFPREAALIQVLTLINHGEIEPLWAEDETIGWIYQYFNSKEERKAMRDASQAPRNSRELAVRNQFFTPRYVVEFLVDNTLGRLWFNWTGGQTGLRDRCQYLLVKPDEQPEPAKRLRDPRTIKLLDPACGSMHFGLYAFDLFLEIYREAWVWEQTHGPGSLDTETGGSADLKPLSQTYADHGAFLYDVPRLIIENNIYGVDIDPRAAQIASLALWLRAQRAWHEAGVKAKDRPQVGRGHVVAAVAPPAEVDLRKRFMEKLDPLDADLFEKTLFLLKGLPELGVLLQVEKELPALVRAVFGDHGGLFRAEDMAQWQKAEARLQGALTEFARAPRSTYQGRLFAEDALQGLRMIDHCREVFDVVVMNPPFGEPSRGTKAKLEKALSRSKGNILAHFIERATQITRQGGRIGAIVSRTCFYLQSFSTFRNTVLAEDLALESFADLGQGVLDAMVETAAATWEVNDSDLGEATFFRELNSSDKNAGLLNSISLLKSDLPGDNYFKRHISQFSIFADSPYIYWIDPSVTEKISVHDPIDPSACSIRVGLQTGNDFRFLRLWWEVDRQKVQIAPKVLDQDRLQHDCIALSADKRWSWYSKTEAASPILSSIHLYVNWSNNGSEIKAYHIGNGHSPSKYVMSESLYFRPGLSYMLRSSRLVPYLVPAGTVPTAGRSQVYPSQGQEMWLAALLSSNLATAVARFRGEAFWAPKFQNSMVAAVPFVKPENADKEQAGLAIADVRSRMAEKYKRDETEILFHSPLSKEFASQPQTFDRRSILGPALDERIAQLCGLTSEEFLALQRDHDESLSKTISSDEDASEASDYADDSEADDGADAVSQKDGLLSWAAGVAFGRFDWRLATREREAPPEPDPFDPLPAKSPGMLPDGAEPFHAHSGILMDDQGHPHDLARLIEEVLARIDAPVPADVRRWLQRDFFKFHFGQYSKSRRKAPIYWPLSTSSGSYTLWLYYPSLTDQTLFTAVNDFIEPKLKQVGQDVAALRTRGSARSSQDEKAFEALQALELELIELRDTLLAIAPTYRPNHDDGVQITAAPLWQLFRHKPWQKILKDTWAKLAKGDYDWAHLAMAYWPDRVREKCETDKSLAIAHDLEHLYVEPAPKPTKARGRKRNG